MQYLVTGANGQLGTELSKRMDDRGLNYWGYDAKNMDITKRDLVF
ncbi:sugar nucleotide-binding protein, partial [Lactiplantibacillus plantarum]